jgi:hypothetical protein
MFSHRNQIALVPNAKAYRALCIAPTSTVPPMTSAVRERLAACFSYLTTPQPLACYSALNGDTNKEQLACPAQQYDPTRPTLFCYSYTTTDSITKPSTPTRVRTYATQSGCIAFADEAACVTYLTQTHRGSSSPVGDGSTQQYTFADFKCCSTNLCNVVSGTASARWVWPIVPVMCLVLLLIVGA